LSCLRRGMSLGSLSERSGGGLGIWVSGRGSADGIVRCRVECDIKKGHEWSWFNCRSSALATMPRGIAVPLCGEGADHSDLVVSRIPGLDHRLAPSLLTLKRAVRRYLSHTFSISTQRPPATFPPRPLRTAKTSSSGPASLIIRKTFIYNQNNRHDCMP
jgi:hypothetical protein